MGRMRLGESSLRSITLNATKCISDHLDVGPKECRFSQAVVADKVGGLVRSSMWRTSHARRLKIPRWSDWINAVKEVICLG